MPNVFGLNEANSSIIFFPNSSFNNPFTFLFFILDSGVSSS